MLDAFAGTGIVSLEAISRGIFHSTLIEKDLEIYNTLLDNIKNLNINISTIELKLSNEALWNQIIYKKYHSKLKINEDKIDKAKLIITTTKSVSLIDPKLSMSKFLSISLF